MIWGETHHLRKHPHTPLKFNSSFTVKARHDGQSVMTTFPTASLWCQLFRGEKVFFSLPGKRGGGSRNLKPKESLECSSFEKSNKRTSHPKKIIQGKLLALFSSGFAICSCPPKKHHKSRWMMNPPKCETPKINAKPTGVFFRGTFFEPCNLFFTMSEGHVWSSADKLVGVHQAFPQKSWRDSAGGISVFFLRLEGRSFKQKLVSHSVHG